MSCLSEKLSIVKLDVVLNTSNKTGVPQGRVLAPIMFYYLYKVHQNLKNFKWPLCWRHPLINKGNKSSNELEKATDRSNIWIKRWWIKANEQKSVNIDFTNRNNHNISTVVNESKSFMKTRLSTWNWTQMLWNEEKERSWTSTQEMSSICCKEIPNVCT